MNVGALEATFSVFTDAGTPSSEFAQFGLEDDIEPCVQVHVKYVPSLRSKHHHPQGPAGAGLQRIDRNRSEVDG